MATFSNLSSLGGDLVEKDDNRLQATGLQMKVWFRFVFCIEPVPCLLYETLHSTVVASQSGDQ